jgi:hypothetical protein
MSRIYGTVIRVPYPRLPDRGERVLSDSNGQAPYNRISGVRIGYFTWELVAVYTAQFWFFAPCFLIVLSVSPSYVQSYILCSIVLILFYCTISTNSSVTGHRALRREEFIDLSQVTLATEEMDRNFRRLRHCHYHLGHITVNPDGI